MRKDIAEAVAALIRKCDELALEARHRYDYKKGAYAALKDQTKAGGKQGGTNE